MERKLGGLLLMAMGIVALIMAYINLMELVANPSYANNLYPTGGKGSSGAALMGYGFAGLVLTFLGIKMLRRPTSM
jgi:hypothetical protein